MTTSIKKGGDGLFDIKVDHWEPKDFVSSSMGKSTNWIKSLFKSSSSKEEDSLGNYEGGKNEGGPWEQYPQLKQAKQDVNIEAMKVRASAAALSARLGRAEPARARLRASALRSLPDFPSRRLAAPAR